MTAPDDGSMIEAAAVLVAANPGGSERALRLHRKRPDGRCGGCTTRLAWWPCAMASIALRAAEIQATRP